MGKTISSKENPIYKEAARLARRKYRDRKNKYLAEGVNVVSELIRDGAAISALLIREGTGFAVIPEAPAYTVSEKLFDTLCQTENSRGVLAVVQKPVYELTGLSGRLRGSGVVVIIKNLIE